MIKKHCLTFSGSIGQMPGSWREENNYVMEILYFRDCLFSKGTVTISSSQTWIFSPHPCHSFPSIFYPQKRRDRNHCPTILTTWKPVSSRPGKWKSTFYQICHRWPKLSFWSSTNQLYKMVLGKWLRDTSNPLEIWHHPLCPFWSFFPDFFLIHLLSSSQTGPYNFIQAPSSFPQRISNLPLPWAPLPITSLPNLGNTQQAFKFSPL